MWHLLQFFPVSSVCIGTSFPCMDDHRISCSPILVMMHQVSLCKENSLHFFARVWSFCASFLWARLTFSCRYTWELSTSKFEPELPQFPLARPTLFFCCRHLRIDQRSRSLWRDILFALILHHQIGKSGLCHRRPNTRGCVLSSIRHGTNHKALSGFRERERTFEVLVEYVGKLMILNNHRS